MSLRHFFSYQPSNFRDLIYTLGGYFYTSVTKHSSRLPGAELYTGVVEESGEPREPQIMLEGLSSQLTATPPSSSTPQATPRCLCLVPSFSLFHFPTSSVFSQNRDTPDQHQQYTQHTTHTPARPDCHRTGLDWHPASCAARPRLTLDQTRPHFSYEA